MSSPPLSVQRITLAVRPPRVAVLCPRDPKYWRTATTSILQWAASFWGGHQVVIIPFEPDGKVRPTFRWLLRLFDPDRLFMYRPTRADLERVDPEGFGAELALLLTNAPDAPENEVLAALRRSPLFAELGPETELLASLRGAVSQLSGWHDHLPFEPLQAGDGPPAWTCPAERVAPKTGPWAQMPCFRLNDLLDVAAEAAFGTPPEVLRNRDSFGTHLVAELRRQDAINGILSMCREGPGHAGPTDLFSFCWPMTRAGLYTSGYFAGIRAGLWNDKHERVLVVGREFEDFAAFLALTRVRRNVFWLPDPLDGSVEATYGTAVLRALAVDPGSPHAPCWVFSESIADLAPTIARLVVAVAGRPFRRTPVITKPVDCLIRQYEEDNGGETAHDEPFIGSQGSTRIPTAMPRYLEWTEHTSWIAEARYSGLEVPIDREEALAAGQMDAARLSSAGLSFLTPTVRVPYAPADVVTRRPQLMLPYSGDTIRLYLEQFGLRGRVSDKGSYLALAIRLFGGVENLVQALADTSTRTLFGYLHGDDPPTAVRHLVPQIDRERVVHRSYFLGNDVSIGSLDAWLHAGILLAGKALRCDQCRRTSWFSMDEAGLRFRCPRCRNESPILSRHSIGDYAPDDAFYRLNGALAEGLRNDVSMNATVMAWLRRLLGVHAFVGPSIEVFNAGQTEPFIELDLIAAAAGEVLLVECKQSNTLREKKEKGPALPKEETIVSRYEWLAEKTYCRGVLFVTAAEKWSDATVAIVEERFANSHVAVAMHTLADTAQMRLRLR